MPRIGRRTKGDGHVPRPPNSFMLYRAAKVIEWKEKGKPEGHAQCQLSKILGAQWRHESQDIKNFYNGLAKQKKEEHQRRYPDYKFQPLRDRKRSVKVPSTQSPTPSTSSIESAPASPPTSSGTSSIPVTPSPPPNPAGTFGRFKVACPDALALHQTSPLLSSSSNFIRQLDGYEQVQHPSSTSYASNVATQPLSEQLENPTVGLDESSADSWLEAALAELLSQPPVTSTTTQDPPVWDYQPMGTLTDAAPFQYVPPAFSLFPPPPFLSPPPALSVFPPEPLSSLPPSFSLPPPPLISLPSPSFSSPPLPSTVPLSSFPLPPDFTPPSLPSPPEGYSYNDWQQH